MSNSSKKSSFLSSKEPWLATNLSFLLPGLGQFYNKNFLKGIFFRLHLLFLFLLDSIYISLLKHQL